MSDATKPYTTTRRAVIRHEITDRAELIRNLWFEAIEQRINHRDDDMGDPDEAVRRVVEKAGYAMTGAIIALTNWESAAEPVDKPAGA